MASRLLRKIMSLGRRSRRKTTPLTGDASTGTSKLSINLVDNLDMIKNALGNSMDLVIREFAVCGNQVALVHINGIVDKRAVRENVLRALMVDTYMVNPASGPGGNSLIMVTLSLTLSGIWPW